MIKPRRCYTEERSFLRQDDKKSVGLTNSVGIGVFVMLRNEASVCDGFALRNLRRGQIPPASG